MKKAFKYVLYFNILEAQNKIYIVWYESRDTFCYFHPQDDGVLLLNQIFYDAGHYDTNIARD